MSNTLVMTVMADDRPGLVDLLSAVVEAQGANWLDSRLAHLAAKFAGVVLIEISPDREQGLRHALTALGKSEGIQITLEETDRSGGADLGEIHTVEVLGPDHPGIVHEITHALADAGANVESVKTAAINAPHGGGTLFQGKFTFRISDRTKLEETTSALEDLAGTLMVEVEVDPTS